MRSHYSKRRSKHVVRENNGFWLTFSDLMSALLLVFVLVMFYSVYSNFATNDELEVQTARLVRQSELFDLKDAELRTSQEKLTDSEREMINQQLQLQLAQESQGKIEQTLAERQKDLDAALALLSMKQEDLAAASSMLDVQQTKLEDQQLLLEDQQIRLDALVGVKAKIVESLAEALKNANVKSKVDEKTGAIALDASVMFDVGKSDLKDSGKLVLDQFLPVYLGVLMQPENALNISEIIIEGHTDSMGNYMNNLKLSQERALAVMEYMLSAENTHLSGSIKERLKVIGTANGRSFSNLVYDQDGQENAEASRRVEFKFRMQDEQMIQSMRDILSGMGS